MACQALGAAAAALLLVLLLALAIVPGARAQVELCQQNCVDSDRLFGPTRMPDTRTHPWKQTVFPTPLGGFCKMGCQLFFAEYPRNTTCHRMCDYYYRSTETVGYSDIVESSKLECKNGCDIALEVCQPGYYCTKGEMMPCAPGKYREAVKGVSIVELERTKTCTLCPPGRYRKTNRGKAPTDCTACPIGKFANIPGSVLVSDCKRCPAGKNAEEVGMAECKCMTGAGNAQSCDMPNKASRDSTSSTVHYYLPDPVTKQSIDFYRETVPFIGRW